MTVTINYAQKGYKTDSILIFWLHVPHFHLQEQSGLFTGIHKHFVYTFHMQFMLQLGESRG